MENQHPEQRRSERLLSLTADIVCAHLAKGGCDSTKIPSLITDVHGTLARLDAGGAAAAAAAAVEPRQPAVPIKKSIGEDFIICLEDGKKFKSLKRHLMAAYGLTPDAYRKKWGLDPDYPMTAPSYAQARSALAKASGLGRKPAGATVQ